MEEGQVILVVLLNITRMYVQLTHASAHLIHNSLSTLTYVHTYIRTHVPKGSHSHELIFCFSHFVTSQQTTVEKT